MIQLPLEYQSGNTLLADLNPDYYITDKGRVVAKLTANGAWAKKIERIAPINFIGLSDKKYKEANELYESFQAYLQEDIQKHGDHNQKTHGRKGSRASFETVSFTGSELSSIATYTKATIQVNRQLRGISRRGIAPSVFDLSENEMDSVIDNLDSAIDKSRLAEKMELGREMPLSMLKRGSVKRSAGKVISDKGFLSLRSTVSSVPPRTGFAKFRVTAPAGTKALDLSFLTPNSMGEIIFPRETKIKINSITGQDDDMVIRGEIVE